MRRSLVMTSFVALAGFVAAGAFVNVARAQDPGQQVTDFDKKRGGSAKMKRLAHVPAHEGAWKAADVELEQELAKFYGRKHAMVFTTGYQANLGVLSTLVGRGDHLILDADSHASIYDGSRLGHAEVIRFRHNDPEHLARLARRHGPGLVIVDSVYSTTGAVCPSRSTRTQTARRSPSIRLSYPFAPASVCVTDCVRRLQSPSQIVAHKGDLRHIWRLSSRDHRRPGAAGVQ